MRLYLFLRVSLQSLFCGKDFDILYLTAGDKGIDADWNKGANNFENLIRL
jgi:hypothetical protein